MVYFLQLTYMCLKHTQFLARSSTNVKTMVMFSRWVHRSTLHLEKYVLYDCVLHVWNTFQRIGQSTRRGGPDKLKLERFMEAMYDNTTGLTFPAGTGQRKQSIRDVEVLFSSNIENCKNYVYEAEFVRRDRNWRRSCDERGLTQL